MNLSADGHYHCRWSLSHYKFSLDNCHNQVLSLSVRLIDRLAVDMDIHEHTNGYINVWISDSGHFVDISMDIMLARLHIKLNTYMLLLSIIFLCLSFSLFIVSFIHTNELSVT